MSRKNKAICDNLDQRIREEDVDAGLMEAVAHCLGDEVRRFAMARCGDVRGDVDDIAQDAMLAAQRYLDGFRGDASLRTWMYRLVLSACSRHRRGRKNDPNLHRSLDDAGPAVEEADSRPEDPEVATMMKQRLGALEAAIAQLRPQDKELLAAVEWQGKSLAEVGEMYDLSVSAVKSRMFRIRQQLRDHVTTELSEPAAGA